MSQKIELWAWTNRYWTTAVKVRHGDICKTSHVYVALSQQEKLDEIDFWMSSKSPIPPRISKLFNTLREEVVEGKTYPPIDRTQNNGIQTGDRTLRGV